jgi:hypothetical protein
MQKSGSHAVGGPSTFLWLQFGYRSEVFLRITLWVKEHNSLIGLLKTW